MLKTSSMVYKTLVIGFIALFITIGFNPSNATMIEHKSIQPLSNGKTLYVGGSGEGNYTKIQDAINDASEGDTVFVYNGTYNESVNIDKSINVIGQDKYSTIIDGQNKRDIVVNLKSDNITFSGFGVIHSKDWANDLGVAVYSSHNIVEDNIISDNPGSKGGIVIRGTYNNIKNNILTNNGEDNGQGILIGYQSHYNFVSGNTIEQNFIGIWLASNHDNIIIGNHISNNNAYGIMISGVGYSEVCNNIIEDNYFAAIDIDMDSTDVLVNENIIKNNGKGLVIDDASTLTVTMNSFYDNSIEFRNKELYYWISHNIYDNTINGKPLYYFKSEKDMVVPSDAGQLILVDCNNCIVKNLHISNVDYGIQLGFSNNNNISSNEFNDIFRNCISFYDSSNNIIVDNNIKNNLGNGIALVGSSSSNNIHNNFIENNKGHGIYIEASENNIHGNNFKKNEIGIYINFGYDNLISENNFIRNKKSPASFTVSYEKQHKNKWKYNYYFFTFGILPRLLIGSVKTRYSWEDPAGYTHYIYRTGFNLDWRPSHKPYDIEV